MQQKEFKTKTATTSWVGTGWGEAKPKNFQSIPHMVTTTRKEEKM